MIIHSQGQTGLYLKDQAADINANSHTSGNIGFIEQLRLRMVDELVLRDLCTLLEQKGAIMNWVSININFFSGN